MMPATRLQWSSGVTQAKVSSEVLVLGHMYDIMKTRIGYLYLLELICY